MTNHVKLFILYFTDPQPGLVTFGNKFVAANFMTNIDKYDIEVHKNLIKLNTIEQFFCVEFSFSV